jgi:flagellar hook-length control protein FliK
MVPASTSLISASLSSTSSMSGTGDRWQPLAVSQGGLGASGEEGHSDVGDFSLVIGSFFEQLNASIKATPEVSPELSTTAESTESEAGVETVAESEAETGWLDAWYGSQYEAADPVRSGVPTDATSADAASGTLSSNIASAKPTSQDANGGGSAEQLFADGATSGESQQNTDTPFMPSGTATAASRSIAAAVDEAITMAARADQPSGTQATTEIISTELAAAASIATANELSESDPIATDLRLATDPAQDAARQNHFLADDGPEPSGNQEVQAVESSYEGQVNEVDAVQLHDQQSSSSADRSSSETTEDGVEDLSHDVIESTSSGDSAAELDAKRAMDSSVLSSSNTESKPQGPVAAAQQISERIRMALIQEPDLPARVEVELDPPELGKVTVELTDRDGGVSARIHATRESTGVLLDQQLNQLRQMLQDAGVEVTDFQVTYDFGQSANEAFQQERRFADPWMRHVRGTSQVDAGAAGVSNSSPTPRSQLDIRI